MAEDQKLEKNNIIFYNGDEGAATIEVFLKDDTMWSTQKTIARLFGVDRSVITKHLKNIFSEGELYEKSVSAKFAHTEAEIKELNRIVNMYLDYAENQKERHKLMSMEDWVSRLDAFLNFNEYDILENPGKVSHAVANEIAGKEFEKYRKIQDKNYVSDFDKEVIKKYLDKKGNNNT
jgi:hypothetical protein